MSLGLQDFDQLSEDGLKQLVTAGVPEGILIEYKRDQYGGTDSDVKEFLKDVSSFANTAGGHLIIGMAEKNGLPTAIAPISSSNSDQELQRLENLMRDGLEPRLVGYRIRAVPIGDKGFVLVIRVPRSWNPPHRVSARNSNRIYARNSAGAYEVSIDELRVLFMRTATAQDGARAFRAERLAKIVAGETPVRLATDRGRLVVHIVPVASFSSTTQINLQPALDYAMKINHALRPLGSSAHDPRINFDGMLNSRGGAECHGYTQLFRNGRIEAVKCGMVKQHQSLGSVVPIHAMEQQIAGQLPNYLFALNELGIPPPLVVMLTLQDVHGCRLAPSDNIDDLPLPFDRSVLELPEIVIDEYATPHEVHRSMRPVLDALWNAGGRLGSPFFNEVGMWVGAQTR